MSYTQKESAEYKWSQHITHFDSLLALVKKHNMNDQKTDDALDFILAQLITSFAAESGWFPKYNIDKGQWILTQVQL